MYQIKVSPVIMGTKFLSKGQQNRTREGDLSDFIKEALHQTKMLQ